VHLMRQTAHSEKERAGMQFEFVPGGYTEAVQILDNVIYKPFKDYIKHEQINLW